MFESQWDSVDSGSATLKDLGRAIRAATQQPRFFRSFPQWCSAFLKYASMAIAASQLEWFQVVMYMGAISRLAHEKGTMGHFLSMLYDDAFRRMLAKRATCRDPDFNLTILMSKINKPLLENCEARLEAALDAAGLSRGKSNVSHPSASSSMDAVLAARDSSATSMLAKQTAAAEAVQRRAEAATRALSKQQEEIMRREQSHRDTDKRRDSHDYGGHRDSNDHGGRGDNNDGGRGKRNQKRAAWQEQRWSGKKTKGKGKR